MKKTLVYGAATAAVVAALGSGLVVTQCVFEPTPAIYGPDPMSSTTSGYEQSVSQESKVEPTPALYGPPPTYSSTEQSGSNASQQADSEEDPEEPDEPIEDIYGPPVR